MSELSRIERLEKKMQEMEDKEAIAALIFRLCRVVDQKDFQAYSECFTNDADFHFGPFGKHKGRKAIREAVEAAESPFDDMQHAYSNLEFVLDGDKATGRGYLWCAVVLDISKPEKHFDFGGPVHWHFARTKDGWLMSDLKPRLMWKSGEDTKVKFNVK